MSAVINAAFLCRNCGLFVLVIATLTQTKAQWIHRAAWQKELIEFDTLVWKKKIAKNGHGAPLAADALFLA